MFENEFNVYNDEGVDMFVEFVQQDNVYSIGELKMKVNIAKHHEYIEIKLNFSDNFKVENIPDNIIISML